MAERGAQGIINETISKREQQLEGVKRAFNIALDEYSEKMSGNLPDLTENSVSMFVQARPALKRALDGCQLVNQTEWPAIALSVLEERIFLKKSKNIEE